MAPQGGVWNDFNRNWTVTEQCIKIAVAKQDLPIMLVGKEKDEVCRRPVGFPRSPPCSPAGLRVSTVSLHSSI